MVDAAASPAPTVLAALRAELRQHPPFAQMDVDHVDAFVAAARQTYYEPGEQVLKPSDGPVRRLLCIRRGAISGQHGIAAEAAGGFLYEAGDLFPVGAVLGERPVTATYHAVEDTFCLEVDAATLRTLAARSAPLADFLNGRVQQFLDLSRRALQAAYASQSLSEQSLEARLETLPRKAPVGCSPDTPVGSALRLMHERRVGSVLALAADGSAAGILTRGDVLERIALRQTPLQRPLSEVMTRPVLALDVGQTAQEAAILMSRHGIRHAPITEHGRVVSMVSERDLFTLQRLSLKQLSSSIRIAADVESLVAATADIRQFARNLLAQGLSARALTELVSHLNDVLTQRLVQLIAQRHGADMGRACWIAFGSEGRSEQTIATDQDNGLVFVSDRPDADRPAWLALARDVNEALDACGFPLCKGLVMASQPHCCLTPDEWTARFAHWMEHGAPEDLLNASIFFDFRPLAGAVSLVEPMRHFVTQRAAQLPRFLRQLAENALRNRPPLNWRGALQAADHDGGQWIDLKLHGTAIFVDAARLYALAHGIDQTSTRRRFEEAAPALHATAQEGQTWVGAFEFLQTFRLRIQVDRGTPGSATDAEPNRVDLATLNDLDRHVLRESFRVARRLQQRLELDYMR